MDILNQLSGIAKSVTDKANSMLEINRLGSKIHAEEEEIKKLTTRIGSWCLLKLDAGQEADEEIMELYRAILNCREKIETLQSTMQKLKEADAEAQAPQVKCSFCGSMNRPHTKFCGECGCRLETEEPEKKVCAVCGAELVEGLKFCGECGTRIEEKAAEKTEEKPQTDEGPAETAGESAVSEKTE